MDDADGAHAEAAREMCVTGDYVTLHINGVRYTGKSPATLTGWSPSVTNFSE